MDITSLCLWYKQFTASRCDKCGQYLICKSCKLCSPEGKEHD